MNSERLKKLEDMGFFVAITLTVLVTLGFLLDLALRLYLAFTK
jgi:hypothetical protein